MNRLIPALILVGLTLSVAGPVSAADDEWERILKKGIQSPYSQTRHNAVKGVDTSTVKGLRALWGILANKNPNQVDWYVREGAYAAHPTKRRRQRQGRRTDN